MNNSKPKKMFVYSVALRVVWISEDIFQIPVIDDLYRVQLIEDAEDVNEDNCTEYVINFSNKFVQTKLKLLPIPENISNEIYLIHEKVKAYVKLSQYVNYSYHSSLPMVFNSEADKIQMLADSFLNNDNQHEKIKHFSFVETLITDKKKELIKRYIQLLNQIQEANDLDTMKKVSYKIVYEAINVV